MKPLRIEVVRKNFGGLWAIDNINLDIELGERRALIGPNGAGKTTLFNIISGLIPPSSGKIFIFGKDVTKMPPHQRVRSGAWPHLPDYQPLLQTDSDGKSAPFSKVRRQDQANIPQTLGLIRTFVRPCGKSYGPIRDVGKAGCNRAYPILWGTAPRRGPHGPSAKSKASLAGRVF